MARRACTEAQANFGSEGPAECPDHRQDRHLRDRLPGLQRNAQRLRLHRRTQARRPVPPLHDRLGLRHQHQARRLVQAQLRNRAADREFEELPQVPFEDFQLHLFSGERALMATPTACTIYTDQRRLLPLGRDPAPNRTSTQVFGLDSGPHGSECPGQIRPFSPSLEAGTSNPTAGAFSSFTLKLNREDGDQYLGKLNFTMPPGPDRQPARRHLLPGGRDRGGRQHPRQNRAGLPELPRLLARSAPPTSPPARGATPSTRSARSTSPAPSRAPRSQPGRDHPGPGRPL